MFACGTTLESGGLSCVLPCLTDPRRGADFSIFLLFAGRTEWHRARSYIRNPKPEVRSFLKVRHKRERGVTQHCYNAASVCTCPRISSRLGVPRPGLSCQPSSQLPPSISGGAGLVVTHPRRLLLIWECLNLSLAFCVFKDFIYLESGREEEREGGKHQCVVGLSCALYWGPGLQPRHVL